MLDIKTGEPYINVWFGNFYRPAYDGEDFIDQAIAQIQELGFNSVMLDSKAWEDFRTRYAGGEASTYVRTQEYMQKRILESGMSYVQLALYLNADNLYPNIRFSPPIYGESVTAADGTDGRWYKYWSETAKESMTAHVRGLYKLYGDGFTRCRLQSGETAEVMCTMWDPIVAPSFDSEGEARYRAWLAERYQDVAALNRAYGTAFGSFDEIPLREVWFACVSESPLYTKEELDADSKAVHIWADNMLWRRDELCRYFADMQTRLKAVSPQLYTCPDMAQWSYFLNIDASALADVGMSDLWDTANRGIDIYKAAKHVDCAHFITVPITPYGDPDPYVVSCQHSMMRAMNKGRDWVGGIYWGRFLYSDVYEFLTPCEILGSMVGAGMDGYTSYGMCGLDDGGVLHRMPQSFLDSLRRGNAWAKAVIPRLTGARRKQVAILFPSAMALLEPMGVAGNKERRCDLLGYYKLCCDLGYMVDVMDADAVADGALEPYAALIIPEDDCYHLDPNPAAETTIRGWVERGGVVIASPETELCARAFGIRGERFGGAAIRYGGEGGLAQSDVFTYFTEGACVASYCAGEDAAEAVCVASDYANTAAAEDVCAASNYAETAATEDVCAASDCADTAAAEWSAVVMHRFGRGRVYAFGFAYGYSYCAKIAPHVPRSMKNQELYPIPMMRRNMVEDILTELGLEQSAVRGKNIETAVFEDGMVVINHTAQPLELAISGEMLFQYETDGTTLMPRSAVYINTNMINE